MPKTPLLPLSPKDVKVEGAQSRGLNVGFIYMESPNYEGQDVRLGYVGGEYNEVAEDDETKHEVDRYAPYVFIGNWGEPTFHQIIAAWDYAVKIGIPGFAEYQRDYGPDTVRWMNGGTFLASDRFTLEMAGNKERQKALATLRKLAKK